MAITRAPKGTASEDQIQALIEKGGQPAGPAPPPRPARRWPSPFAFRGNWRTASTLSSGIRLFRSPATPGYCTPSWKNWTGSRPKSEGQRISINGDLTTP